MNEQCKNTLINAKTIKIYDIAAFRFYLFDSSSIFQKGNGEFIINGSGCTKRVNKDLGFDNVIFMFVDSKVTVIAANENISIKPNAEGCSSIVGTESIKAVNKKLYLELKKPSKGKFYGKLLSNLPAK